MPGDGARQWRVRAPWATTPNVVLFLATAGVVVPIFRRFRLSPVLAFLGAGVALGPFGLGALQGELPWLRYVTMKSSASMDQLAEFGVVFLLFAIGLELSWERLWTMRRFVFGLGGSQVRRLLGRHRRRGDAVGPGSGGRGPARGGARLVVDGRRDAAAGGAEPSVLAAGQGNFLRVAPAGSCRGADPGDDRRPRRPSRRGPFRRS